jgi:beta-glucosidase
VKLHGQGYITALKEGVGSIMPSYNSWNGVKASASEPLLTGLLKKEMGFEGFLISDYNALDDIPGDFRSDIKTSINAGMDMVMVPSKTGVLHDAQKPGRGKEVRCRASTTRRRILRVKFAMGLMDPKRNQLADRSKQASVGSAEHRAVARQAVRESLVLLKNDKLLPIAATAKRIHVAGVGANDIGIQTGGLDDHVAGPGGPDHQGHDDPRRAQGGGEGRDERHLRRRRLGRGRRGPGRRRRGRAAYAEMFGDTTDLAINKDDLAALAAVKASGVPYVVVVLSGRPVILGDIATSAGAIVAAWWPGRKGQGVADVLTGAYKPTGKLAFTWPKSVAQADQQAEQERRRGALPVRVRAVY